VIGDGDPMRVAAQIAQDVPRATEGRLGVDHPVLAMHSSQESMELFWISQRGCRPGTAEPLAPMEALQTGAELAAEYAPEDLHWQKERETGAHPTTTRPLGWRSERGDEEAGSVPRCEEY